MISLARVTKAYGGTTILDDVTLHVSRGDCVRIAGAPQSGRTTLLRLAATLVAPTSGTVSIDGIDAARNPAAARRRIAYVSPDVLSGARLRVDEYLWLVARARRATPGQRVTEAAERCGLDLRADVERLTADPRAALAVAAALVTAADIFLLDDALGTSTDPARRVRLVEAIRDARDRGATMLVVSNAQDELTAMCGRIVTLERGRVHEGLPTLRQPEETAWAR